MKIIVVIGIALLSLSSVAEAHRLSGTAAYYGGSRPPVQEAARLPGRDSTAAQ